MKGEILRKYGGLTVDDDREDDTGLIDLHAFGYLRGVRDRSVMLELRQKDGSVCAFNYGWLERAEFDPSEGIKLWFGGKVVTITGRNLNAQVHPSVRLFDAIVRHRVSYIQECDGPSAMKASREALVVDGISVK